MTIFKWKNLVVFSGMSLTVKVGRKYTACSIYWGVDGNPSSYGPFATITDALCDYSEWKRNNGVDLVPEPQVISVDFVNKKKLDFIE